MPMAAPRACPQCGQKIKGSRCLDCNRAAHSRHDETRGSSTERGYDSVWRAFRNYFLLSHPLCVACQRSNIVEPASVVDHIKPLHLGGAHCNEANSQALCKACHDRKTSDDKKKYKALAL